MNNIVQVFFIAYGLMLFAGAYFGLKVKSKVSCIMGITFGLLTFVGLYIAQSDQLKGYQFLVGISALLTGVFISRFVKTKKFMPAGMLMAASVIALILSIWQITR